MRSCESEEASFDLALLGIQTVLLRFDWRDVDGDTPVMLVPLSSIKACKPGVNPKALVGACLSTEALMSRVRSTVFTEKQKHKVRDNTPSTYREGMEEETQLRENQLLRDGLERIPLRVLTALDRNRVAWYSNHTHPFKAHSKTALDSTDHLGKGYISSLYADDQAFLGLIAQPHLLAGHRASNPVGNTNTAMGSTSKTSIVGRQDTTVPEFTIDMNPVHTTAPMTSMQLDGEFRGRFAVNGWTTEIQTGPWMSLTDALSAIRHIPVPTTQEPSPSQVEFLPIAQFDGLTLTPKNNSHFSAD
ncbi:hypothetical protein GNI_144350 [Gregarina niphandrodes]|uniref:Uncharacterized protein n=1 Tax=Gregarina niphandrodes TaxID=110365 RepID=A0A023B0N6_GRENI|nr:hypothetical protein GNI_144350 [Gregarina niphandrodes]EZG44734.1 hypothetical protein GNI_144350 [Gregarina niphandrodes]|eukprot:XP_011134128.1 hypothetical protein GNI_144350 [Gregarina niphandrodes]